MIGKSSNIHTLSEPVPFSTIDTRKEEEMQRVRMAVKSPLEEAVRLVPPELRPARMEKIWTVFRSELINEHPITRIISMAEAEKLFRKAIESEAAEHARQEAETKQKQQADEARQKQEEQVGRVRWPEPQVVINNLTTIAALQLFRGATTAMSAGNGFGEKGLALIAGSSTVMPFALAISAFIVGNHVIRRHGPRVGSLLVHGGHQLVNNGAHAICKGWQRIEESTRGMRQEVSRRIATLWGGKGELSPS